MVFPWFPHGFCSTTHTFSAKKGGGAPLRSPRETLSEPIVAQRGDEMGEIHDFPIYYLLDTLW
jgi:hypothetical protein